MNWLTWALIALLFLLLSTVVVSVGIYTVLLTRLRPKKWGRGPSMPGDQEYDELYRQAEAWRDEHLSAMREVNVENDGLQLYGEYFDFGHDKAVIIIPGRMEACHYSCHYGEPYRKAGYNVLTVDGRAHGRSEGKINSLGYMEYRDILAWAKMLNEKENIRDIVLHGVCIGSSTAVFCAAAPECPEYVRGIVVDGLYQRFYDSCRNHMIHDGRPLYPFMAELTVLIRLFSGADVVHDGPKWRIKDVRRPILFLHSRTDKFSTPDKAQELYDLCPSENKTICWFEDAWHSRVRLKYTDRYDQAVTGFLNKL